MIPMKGLFLWATKVKKETHNTKTSPNNEAAQQPTSRWSPLCRGIVSALLIVHMVGIFAAALSNPGPTSQSVLSVRDVYRPYLRGAFLDHGYQFFAPDPGPTHLVEYEIIMNDGEKVTGVFPDREEHFPRLLYHRWFMLAESMFTFAAEIPTQEQFDQDKAQYEADVKRLMDEGKVTEARQIENNWNAMVGQMEYSKRLANKLYTRVASYLLEQHGGEQITLYSLERVLPGPNEVNAGHELDDPMFLEFPGGRRELIRYPLEEVAQ